MNTERKAVCNSNFVRRARFALSDTHPNGDVIAPQCALQSSGMPLRNLIGQLPSGSWVAISLGRKYVVGLGSTAAEARQAARIAGEREVILLRVPEKVTRNQTVLM
jgi:hypothetical protein